MWPLTKSTHSWLKFKDLESNISKRAKQAAPNSSLHRNIKQNKILKNPTNCQNSVLNQENSPRFRAAKWMQNQEKGKWKLAGKLCGNSLHSYSTPSVAGQHTVLQKAASISCGALVPGLRGSKTDLTCESLLRVSVLTCLRGTRGADMRCLSRFCLTQNPHKGGKLQALLKNRQWKTHSRPE